MTNAARGEQKISIGGAEFVLAMEYERIVEVEATLGVGVLALAGRFSLVVDTENLIVALAASPVSLQDTATCIWILSGKKYELKDIGKLILKEGLSVAVGPLSDFFATAIAGDPVGESEAGDQEATDDSQ